jgi:cytochrome c biogenesis factor
VAGTTARSDRFVTFEPGETRTIAGHELTHRSVELVDEPARTVGRATLEVDGRDVHPAIVAHDLRHVRTTEFAQLLRVDHELQIAFVDGNAAGATYRVIRQPLLPLVWLGALIIVVALLSDGRRGGGARLVADDQNEDDESFPRVRSANA